MTPAQRFEDIPEWERFEDQVADAGQSPLDDEPADDWHDWLLFGFGGFVAGMMATVALVLGVR